MNDEQCMARALSLAERGRYSAAPNPCVGALLVRDGAIIGRGWHRAAGEPHAEAVALDNARKSGHDTRGATCYVTLEPCNHRGRTPPCTAALLDAGIKTLWYGAEDPDPRVCGGGLEALRKGGVGVRGPLLEARARAQNCGFFKRMASGRPWVHLKMAASLDGRTAMADGHSFWITGPEARADSMRLRARCCAIITSWRTVARDQSAMTVRPADFGLPRRLGARQPLRVLLDRRGRLPVDNAFWGHQVPTLVVGALARGSPPRPWVELMDAPLDDGRVSLRDLLGELGRRQCNEVMVECGARLAAGFMGAALVDRLVLYLAPKVMGRSALPLFDMAMEQMDAALPLRLVDSRRIGPDLRLRLALDTD